MMYNGLMCDFYGTIQNLPTCATYVCAAAVGVCIIGAGAFRVARECARGGRKIAAASLVGAMLVGGMVVVGTDVGGAKPGTNDVSQVEGGTNQMENGEWRVDNARGIPGILHSPFSILHLSAALPENVVTDQDISNRWRVVSVLSNSVDSSIFTFPSAAIEQSNNQTIEQSPIVWEAAQRRGAVFGAWHIPLEGWNFPFDGHGWSNAFMRCEGVLRDSFCDACEQIRFLAPFALCPAANWSRYNLPASRAWCATNELGGLTVAVENGALGNDSSKIVSARLDLDPSLGEIRLRYDLSQIGETAFDVGPTVNGTNTFVTVGSNTSEVVFRRVHPEDWDYDGIPNDLDPDPRVPDVGAGWNQSDAWAMLAYPSNATEIASVGYAAWVAALAADPNRRLVGFTVASANGNWPVRLTVDDVPVLCDGREELKFVLDYGKRYSISCSNGRIDAIALHGTNDVGIVASSLQAPGSAFPYEGSVGNLTVHLDAPGRGWICFSAEVDILLDGGDVVYFGQGDGAGGIFGHFTPGSTHVLTGELHQCHSNAFLGCTWSGGPGFSFSNPESLATEVTWTAVDASAWATNFLSLVTRYEGGYSLTNVVVACVGPEHVPPTGFSLSCQDVLFLNDDRRLERIYPVNVSLTGTNGVSGAVALECNGADSKLAFDPYMAYMDAPTNRLEFTMSIDEGYWFSSSRTVYLSSSQIGFGEISATISFTNGTSCATSKVFNVIEPLRKLVNETRFKPRHIYNPSRLVHGDEAYLRVGVNGAFNPGDITWRVVSGPGNIVASAGMLATVEATATNGTVVVEARFNEDAIQPTFVLPIVKPRVIPVRVFVAPPPWNFRGRAWQETDIRTRIDVANEVFSQVGITFELLSMEFDFCSETIWNAQLLRECRDEHGNLAHCLTDQAERLLNHYQTNDCVELYFLGTRPDGSANGFCHPKGVVMFRESEEKALAHELGHLLGLEDCYSFGDHGDLDEGNWTFLSYYNEPANAFTFIGKNDWGDEWGRGFYERTDTHHVLYAKFLMFGYDVPDARDIPDGQVLSLRDGAESPNDILFAEIGAEGIKKTNQEVYTK